MGAAIARDVTDDPRLITGIPSGMSVEVSDGLEKLRQEMRRRRFASLDSGQPIYQTEVADAMGVTSASVSRLETGTRSLRNLSGEMLGRLLAGYGFSNTEIARAVSEYNLNAPPNLLAGEPAPGIIEVADEGSISYPHKPIMRRYHDQTEGRFAPSDLSVREVSPRDRVTARAKDVIPVGARLWLHRTLSPKVGGLAIVQQDGMQALAIWPVTDPTYVFPIRPQAGNGAMLLDPEIVELVATVVTVSQHLV